LKQLLLLPVVCKSGEKEEVMLKIRTIGLLLVLCAVTSGNSFGQRMGFGGPPSIQGFFNPVVGSGAEYSVKNQNEPKISSFAFAVVGKEPAEGGDAYWFEIRASGEGQSVVMKQLMLIEGGTPQIKRMIVQPAGRPPMEMPVTMMNRAMSQHQGEIRADKKDLGQLVGTEDVTVPAGTFVCEHYKSNRNDHPADLWISSKVSPYGLVKLQSPTTTMELVKVLDHATSQIQGEPQKFSIPGIPGR
jgi:hypothetical protein